MLCGFSFLDFTARVNMESDESISNPGSKAPCASASAPANSDNKKRSRIRRQSRAGSHLSNTNSSDSSSSSSSSSSDSSPRRSTPRHRNKKRGGKRRHRHDSRKFRKLTRQVDDLRKQLIFCNNNSVPCAAAVHFNENLVDGNVSGELYEDPIINSVEVPAPVAQSDFTFEIETKLKEPSIPKTPQEFLQTLKDLQHLDSSDWCEVRYAETQKLYNSTPGFIDLEMNEEIRAYDSLRHLAHADRAFAALSFCILKQREALQTSVRSFLQWARGSDLSYEGINEKVNELFLKGDFFKVSSDLLQLTCGHRAEVIQMRRDGITNHVRDPLVKAVLRKIPPSCQHVFNAESLATALEKAGGVRKAFLPLQKPGSSASVSQTGQSKPARRPSQGQALRNVPSQGTAHGCCAPTHISHAYNQPSQGYCNARPSQGHGTNHDDNRPSFSGGSRGSFRGRGSRQGYRQHDSKNSRKRAVSPSENYNRNKKRKY